MANTNTTTVQKLPDYLEQASKSLVGRAQELSNKPYTPFPGPKIAGFDPDQLKAFDLTRSAVGSWTPYISGASRSFTDPGVAESYMNPYRSNVINDALDNLSRTFDQQLRQIRNATLASNAYGDDRAALLEGRAREGFARTAAQTLNQLLDQGYQAGANQFNTEQQQRMSLAQLVPALQLQDIGALWNVGAQRQALAQRNLDQAVADFAAQVGYPYTQINFLRSILSGTPYEVTQKIYPPNNSDDSSLATALGSLGLLAGGMGSLFFGNSGLGFANILGF